MNKGWGTRTPSIPLLLGKQLMNEIHFLLVKFVMLGLGWQQMDFNPFKSRSVSHSIWPIVLIPYNGPPLMCMSQDNSIMSVLIDCPSGSGNDIDIYMQPLIEELLDLWGGVRTYDVSKKEVFAM